MLGNIHSIETFGSVDGPGVRFVIFVQGCQLRCAYCHNADTWNPAMGEKRSTEELLDYAERYRDYWGEKGGITVSGGEPLLQIDFLIELFEKAHARGMNTCIDTAGQPFTREIQWFAKFQRLMKSTDLLLVDIKHIDSKEHIRLTGKSNENILDMFHYLDSISKPIWIRHVLVPGITDDDEALRKTGKFIRTLHNVERIEVLPYHSMGAYKWEKLGIPYRLEGVKSPSEKSVEKAERILRGEQDLFSDIKGEKERT